MIILMCLFGSVDAFSVSDVHFDSLRVLELRESLIKNRLVSIFFSCCLLFITHIQRSKVACSGFFVLLKY